MTDSELIALMREYTKAYKTAIRGTAKLRIEERLLYEFSRMYPHRDRMTIRMAIGRIPSVGRRPDAKMLSGIKNYLAK